MHGRAYPNVSQRAKDMSPLFSMKPEAVAIVEAADKQAILEQLSLTFSSSKQPSSEAAVEVPSGGQNLVTAFFCLTHSCSAAADRFSVQHGRN